MNEKFGNNVWIAEITQKNSQTHSKRSRPDLIGYIDGIKIVIECSYDKLDAQRDARKRIKYADIVVALHYPKIIAGGTLKIKSQLQKSSFFIKIIRPYSSTNDDWFAVTLGDLETSLFNLSSDFLKNVDQFVTLIQHGAHDFACHLLASDSKLILSGKILNLFYRHLGQGDWPVDETSDELIIYKQAYLSIVLSALFYQTVKPNYDILKPLESDHTSLRKSIITQFQNMINNINYEPVFYVAIQVLNILPDTKILFEKILDTVSQIIENPAVLHKDLAGRLYHQIVGDKKIMKGLATYFTQIPSSYLLARLAITDNQLANGIPINTSVVDFACGSGTLLMAAYSALADLHRSTSNLSPRVFHKKILESNLHGYDVLRYALQITALNLLLRQPSEPVAQLHLTAAPLSGSGDGRLGSLELLSKAADLTAFLPYDPRVKGTDVVFGKSDSSKTITPANDLSSLMDLRAYDISSDWNSIVNRETTRIISTLESCYDNSNEFKLFYNTLSFIIPFLYKNRLTQPTMKMLYDLFDSLHLETTSKLKDIIGAKNTTMIIPQIKAIPKSALQRLADMILPYAIPQQLDPRTKFDLVIMNPPFTRASRGGAAGNTIFGFTGDNATTLDARFTQLMQDLTLTHPINSSKLPNGTPNSHNSSALAGLGVAFIHLAVQRVKPNGRIAFVVPRGLIQGSTWTDVRQLLLNTCHIEYIISRMDGTGYVNFSESTDLSEIMFVAKRFNGNESTSNIAKRKTKFCILKTPLISILDAIRFTAKIQKCFSDDDVDITEVCHSNLQSHINNWGRYAIFLNSPYPNILNRIEKGNICFNIKLHMSSIGDQCTIGVVSRRFTDSLKRGSGSYPVVWGGGEGARSTINVQSNEVCHAITSNGTKILKRNPANLLLPDRIWLDTIHTFALWCDEKVLSNTFFAINLNTYENNSSIHKALCVWLNSIWGIVSILGHQTITRGKWSRLSISRWRMLLIPNMSHLPSDVINSLALLMDKYKYKDFGRFPIQFSKNSIREKFDYEILKILVDHMNMPNDVCQPDPDVLLNEIHKLYEMLNTTFDALSKQPDSDSMLDNTET